MVVAFNPQSQSSPLYWKMPCLALCGLVGFINSIALGSLYFNKNKGYYHDPTTLGVFITSVVVDITIFIYCCYKKPYRQVTYEQITDRRNV